jgi:hypothetical protein
MPYGSKFLKTFLADAQALSALRAIEAALRRCPQI